MLDSRPLGTFPEYTGTSADKASSLVDEIDEDALLFTHVSSRTVLVPRVVVTCETRQWHGFDGYQLAHAEGFHQKSMVNP